MLNERLFVALRDLFGKDPTIANEGEEAKFSCPPLKHTPWKRKTKRYAKVDEWGECYTLDCPECGDSRNRLWFSHLYGMTTKSKNVTYYFGRVYTCYNEKCDLSKSLSRLSMDLNQHVIDTKPSAFISIIQAESTIPKGCLPLLNPDVPEYVLSYLYGRGFDPVALANNLFVHFAPKGVIYEAATEVREARQFYEDRLLIPIIQGNRFVGYQARRFTDKSKGAKYMTIDAKASKSLYGRDSAMFHRDIVIVEGPTDVWRIGPNSVALFGKTLKPGQLSLMKLLWGFSGRAIVCLDNDKPTATNTNPGYARERVVARLRREGVFPRGVIGLELPEGRDPASLPEHTLHQWIQEAFLLCR